MVVSKAVSFNFLKLLFTTFPLIKNEASMALLLSNNSNSLTKV